MEAEEESFIYERLWLLYNTQRLHFGRIGFAAHLLDNIEDGLKRTFVPLFTGEEELKEFCDNFPNLPALEPFEIDIDEGLPVICEDLKKRSCYHVCVDIRSQSKFHRYFEIDKFVADSKIPREL